MRLLVTKGPHEGQVLDFGSAQAAAAMRDGWAIVPFPEGEPALLHHDQVIPVPPQPPAPVEDFEGEPTLGQGRVPSDLLAPFVKPSRGRR